MCMSLVFARKVEKISIEGILAHINTMSAKVGHQYDIENMLAN